MSNSLFYVVSLDLIWRFTEFHSWQNNVIEVDGY